MIVVVCTALVFCFNLGHVVCVFPASTGLVGQMKLNGGMDGQPVVKRRRGRRKNVEGMDLLFMNRKRGPAVPESVRSYFTFLSSLCCSTSSLSILSLLSCYLRSFNI